MSLGGTTKSRALQTAVENAYSSGILLIAAGNNGYDKKGNITYPAKYSSVIAVGAIDQENNRAYFSSVGKELELMAPGVSIYSTVLGGYALNNGTSMVAPHVAGVAALVWESRSELTNEELRKSLNETAITLGNAFEYGNGLVDAQEAVTDLALTAKGKSSSQNNY